MPTTPRLAIPTPVGPDPADVPADLGRLVAPLDLAVVFGKGTVALMPPSSVGAPGIGGRLWYVEDPGQPQHHHLFYDHGTGWLDLGPFAGSVIGEDSITAYELAPSSVTSVELAALAVGSGHIQAGIVAAVHVAAALKPSGGAGAGAEALRALGLGAGMAAAGSHNSQHGAQGADPIPFATFIMRGLKSTMLAITPATWNTNALFIVTDEFGGTPYQSTGSAWVKIARGATEAIGGTIAHADSSSGFPGLTGNPTLMSVTGPVSAGQEVVLEYSCSQFSVDDTGGGGATLTITAYAGASFLGTIGRFRSSGSWLRTGATLKSPKVAPGSGDIVFSVRASKSGSGPVGVNDSGDNMSLEVRAV